MVMVTQRAAEQIKKSAGEDQSNAPGQSLRIAAQRKPDRSIDYAMGFDEVGVSDTQYKFYGVDVVIAASSEALLEGATLDFVELEAGDRQFIFLNPNDPNYVAPKEDEPPTDAPEPPAG